jgi:type IV pilus assembly protein PilN
VNLQLNLATKVYVDFRKVNLVLLVLFSLVFAWCAFSLYSLASNYAEIQQLTEYKAKSLAKTSGGKVSDAEFNRLMAEIKLANAILDKRRYDWLTQMQNLEGVVPDGVSLSSIAPGEKSDLIKVVATARNFAAVRQFVENLEGSSKFADVFLAELKYVKEGPINKGISFTVTCKVLL